MGRLIQPHQFAPQRPPTPSEYAGLRSDVSVLANAVEVLNARLAALIQVAGLRETRTEIKNNEGAVVAYEVGFIPEVVASAQGSNAEPDGEPHH